MPLDLVTITPPWQHPGHVVLCVQGTRAQLLYSAFAAYDDHAGSRRQFETTVSLHVAIGIVQVTASRDAPRWLPTVRLPKLTQHAAAVLPPGGRAADTPQSSARASGVKIAFSLRVRSCLESTTSVTEVRFTHRVAVPLSPRCANICELCVRARGRRAHSCARACNCIKQPTRNVKLKGHGAGRLNGTGSSQAAANGSRPPHRSPVWTKSQFKTGAAHYGQKAQRCFTVSMMSQLMADAGTIFARFGSTPCAAHPLLSANSAAETGLGRNTVDALSTHCHVDWNGSTRCHVSASFALSHRARGLRRVMAPPPGSLEATQPPVFRGA